MKEEKILEKEKTVEELKEVITQKQIEKTNRCKERIEKILMEENCFLDASVNISNQGATFNIGVFPKEEK